MHTIYYIHRSTILSDVAASSSRNRPQVTKTLLVLGECTCVPVLTVAGTLICVDAIVLT